MPSNGTTTETSPAHHDLLTTREAAHQLRLSAATLERLRVTGGGPRFIKLGPSARARVVYRQADLEAWLHGNERTDTQQGDGHA